MLTVGLCCLRKSAWSFLLKVEIRFGLSRSQCKIGLVFFTYSSLHLEIGFGFLLLTAPPPAVVQRQLQI